MGHIEKESFQTNMGHIEKESLQTNMGHLKQESVQTNVRQNSRLHENSTNIINLQLI